MCTCVFVCCEGEREREAAEAGGGRSGREGWGGWGGGRRTKESNLNEMTFFRGVKLGELGFCVPSPCRYIHLERLDLHVYTLEYINRQEELTEREKIEGGERKRDGDLV